MDRTIRPQCLSDETAITPMAMFALVDGQPVVFPTDNQVGAGRELDYAKAVRQLYRQVIERLDRWIRLAEAPVVPRPKVTP